MLTRRVKAYQRAHPGQPVVLKGLLRVDPTVFMLIRGLSEYDPRFGASFHDGTWNEGFDQTAALARIRCPVLLMQANWSINHDGLLDGAMKKDEAQRAMLLLKHGTYLKVDAGHVVNLDKPKLWLKSADAFFLGT